MCVWVVFGGFFATSFFVLDGADLDSFGEDGLAFLGLGSVVLVEACLRLGGITYCLIGMLGLI